MADHLQWGVSVSNNELATFLSASSLVAVSELPNPPLPLFGYNRVGQVGGEINQPLKHDLVSTEFVNQESRTGISPTVFGRKRII
jgi:hypothetical protein